jgi:hypothetical protein
LRRNGRGQGWTLLHQAAYWRSPKLILQRLRALGAEPHLPGQNFQQLQVSKTAALN